MHYALYPYDVIPLDVITFNSISKPDNCNLNLLPYDFIPPTSSLLIVLINQTMLTHIFNFLTSYPVFLRHRY